MYRYDDISSGQQLVDLDAGDRPASRRLSPAESSKIGSSTRLAGPCSISTPITSSEPSAALCTRCISIGLRWPLISCSDGVCQWNC